jgi:hypothetical protein
MYLQVCGGEEKGGNTRTRALLVGPGHGEAMGEGAGA